MQWGGGTDNIAKRWRILNVTTDGAVYYGYAVVAGLPGEVKVEGLDPLFNVTLPEAAEPWFIVQAKGDINGDGTPSLYLGSSFSNQVYWVNEGE